MSYWGDLKDDDEGMAPAAAAPAPPNDSRSPHPPCCYCEKDAVSGLAIEHSGLAFCSVACLWDAAFCDGFDTALDKVRAQKFEPIGDVLDSLELEIINTTPRREPARKGRGPKLATCACGARFQPNDGIGGDRCASCAEKGSSRS